MREIIEKSGNHLLYMYNKKRHKNNKTVKSTKYREMKIYKD